jgi:hypothetical protein
VMNVFVLNMIGNIYGVQRVFQHAISYEKSRNCITSIAE